MRTNAYTEYDPEDFDYFYPFDFDRRNKYYLANRYKPSFTWSYGDPIRLEFYITDIEMLADRDVSGWWSMADPVGYGAAFGTMFGGNQSDIPFEGIEDTGEKKILVEFYNSDFEPVYSTVVFGSDRISVDIDVETSATLFYRGVFYCSLKIVDMEDKPVRTLLNSQDCSLYVR